MKKLLTIEECAELLNVKISWLRRKIYNKEIPYVKLGHLIRFDTERILNWVKEQEEAA